jgi:hypothetical protein
MTRVSRRSRILGICALAIVVVVGAAALAAQADRSAGKKWPPQFPREGATKLFENDHVIVWEQVGRPKEPFVHKHIHDILTFAIEGGRIDVLNPDGSKPATNPDRSSTTTVYSRGTSSLTYSTAGLGPHAEVAPDPDHIPRSIFVELKGTEPRDCRAWSTACP